MVLVYIIISLCALTLILFGVWLFCLFPSRRKFDFFEKHKYFAHRGLHDNAETPENSLPAFALAAEKGYGIELDVHLTSDGKLIVFHDDDTTRMCGVSALPEKLTFGELRELKLLNTEEKIPLFEEVLSLVGGRVPLIVELKGVTFDPAVCIATAEALDKYKGEYCVESFNPFFVRWWKKNRPSVIRGQLACRMPKQKSFIKKIEYTALGNMAFNAFSRPDFVAYDLHGRRRVAFRLARALGAIPVAWTVKNAKELETARKGFVGYIFENEEDTLGK